MRRWMRRRGRGDGRFIASSVAVTLGGDLRCAALTDVLSAGRAPTTGRDPAAGRARSATGTVRATRTITATRAPRREARTTRRQQVALGHGDAARHGTAGDGEHAVVLRPYLDRRGGHPRRRGEPL